MASNTLGTAAAGSPRRDFDRPAPAFDWRALVAPLASLKLTVALFAVAILLIFAGTLAQVDKDIWEVMDLYFRRWVAWVPFQIFFPKMFFPGLGPVPGGTYLPGGFLLGTVMATNLLAAHAVRFTVQAHGNRLLAGLLVIVLGAALGWLVVLGGSDKDLVEGSSAVNASLLWIGVKCALAALWLAILYRLWHVPAERRLERWGLGIIGVLLGSVLGILLYFGSATTPDPSGMRILLQLVKATGVSLLLLLGCSLAFRHRAGIVLLHAGVGLMMVNELVVYSLHSEGVMRIREGETANFVEDIRTVELAVVDPSDKDEDGVTVIPKRLLLDSLAGARQIDDAHLPADVLVKRFYVNSALRPAGPHEPNTATVGDGLKQIVEEKRPTGGAEASKEVDIPAAYVELLDKSTHAPLGTWLVGLELPPQAVEIGGHTYELSLRFKRDYKPFALTLIDVRKDDYPGTDKPRNYSSDVELVDAGRKLDRKVRIWMNNPLRYAGETIYQSGYNKVGNHEISTLQVVKNTGWMIPYMGCMMVAVGLVAQFGRTLVRFLRGRGADELESPEAPAGAASAGAASAGRKRRAARRRDRTERADPTVPRERSGWALYVIPAVVVIAAGAWLASMAREPQARPGELHFYEFGKLPIVYEGRTKPIDTVARNSLQMLSGRQTYLAPDGQRQPAVRWLLDVITQSKASFQAKVFKIDNPEVRDTLGLSAAPKGLYSIEDIQPQLAEFEKQVRQAHDLDPHELTTYQKKLLELDKKLRHYMLLMAAFEPPHLRKDHELDDLLASRERHQTLLDMQAPLAVPPPADAPAGRWKPFAVAWSEAYGANLLRRPLNPATLSWETILAAYNRGDADAFDKAVATYRGELESHPPADVNSDKLDFESFFNHFEPFFWAWILDIGAFLLTCLAWFGYRRVLNRTAFWLLLFTLAVHTLGICSRIYISGRPPVTNLYSSALFIGWGGMVLGLVLEATFRLGIGNLIASVSGFATLQIAHYLSGDGDTLIVMQAVLDTQFWLATHVVCVTLGYATTFVAGLLGIIYVLRRAFTSTLTAEAGKDMARMIYGTVCFAMFFSFFGTVLGGLWADDSWGRFWGWDPKENGALIIVLWNALVLHARWGGMVKDRGLAVLAMVGNIVTAWSWFGVNELGAGLHSYGFTEGVAKALALAILVQLGIIALGLLPQKGSPKAEPGVV